MSPVLVVETLYEHQASLHSRQGARASAVRIVEHARCA